MGATGLIGLVWGRLRQLLREPLLIVDNTDRYKKDFLVLITGGIYVIEDVIPRVR